MADGHDNAQAIFHLYSSEKPRQLQGCTMIHELLLQELPGKDWQTQRRVTLDQLAQWAERTMHSKSLAARLVDLAADTTADGEQLACAAFQVLALCCSQADLAATLVAEELAGNSSGLAAAVLAQYEMYNRHHYRQEGNAMRMYLLQCAAGLSAHQHVSPAWLRPNLYLAQEAVRECTESQQLLAALRLLYSFEPFEQSTTKSEQLVLLLVDRGLHVDASLSMHVRAAAAALLVKLWLQRYRGIICDPLPDITKFLWGLDLTALPAMASAAPCGSDLELWLLRAHLIPVTDGMVQGINVWPAWVANRLVARVWRAPRVGTPGALTEALRLLDMLKLVMNDQLGENGPGASIKEACIAAGLMPALASWLAARDVDGVAAADLAISFLRNACCEADFTAIGNAASGASAHHEGADEAYEQALFHAMQSSRALATAIAGVYGAAGPVALLTKLQPLPDHQVLPHLANMRTQRTAAATCADTAAINQLKQLRICSHARCCKVEDAVNSHKACGACVDRSTNGGGGGCSCHGNDATSSNVSCDHGNSSGCDASTSNGSIAYYCSKECQIADRFGGHAHCLLGNIPSRGKEASSLLWWFM